MEARGVVVWKAVRERGAGTSWEKGWARASIGVERWGVSNERLLLQDTVMIEKNDDKEGREDEAQSDSVSDAALPWGGGPDLVLRSGG